jgi:lipopolysaccharide export system permease protein
MKTVRRLIYRELALSIAYVCLGFLALFLFFDLVDELSANRPTSYQFLQAFGYVALLMPGHLYELLPIGVLIGTVMVMARFAQSSEFTILRTSGLSPWLALKTLLIMGAILGLLTFVIGDYIAPAANQAGQFLKAKSTASPLTLGRTGAWLKERQAYTHFAVNVGALTSSGTMTQVRIYEFNHQGMIVSLTDADTANFDAGAWRLNQAQRTEFPSVLPTNQRVDRASVPLGQDARLLTHALPEYRWPTEMTAPMIAAALLKPERMGLVDLFRYSQHLDENGQTSQLYETEFWKKLFYPLSCLVMMVLGLPFAYLHFRQGGISGYVFVGVIAGISFILLNNVFGYIGLISNWQPWFAAAAPSLLYLTLSLGAFSWVVLKR